MGSRLDHSTAEAEAALARRAASGEREAFCELVRRHEAPLFRYLLATCGSREDAEELAQETLLRAWEKLDRYDSRWRFSTWLFTLGRRLLISRHRRGRDARGRRVELDAAYGVADTRIPSLRPEACDGLWSLAARVLGEQQRSTLWLRYAEELSAEEIGHIQGRRAGAVRVALHRARLTLAEHLDPSWAQEPGRPDAQSDWDGPLGSTILEVQP